MTKETSHQFDLPTVNLPVADWDVVLTCFEPLVAVTGGIGTYHRLLLKELAKSKQKTLVLTRGKNEPFDLPETIKFINVDLLVPEVSFNFVGTDHEYFSLRCHFAFKSLYEQGHRFGLVEFSDYGGDGFYPLRARASGAYEFGVAAVRLHSPRAMLVEDNGGDFVALDNYHRDQIDRELSVYQDADVILYGGEAMRQRVAEICERFGVSIDHKMTKCPHPYPRHLFKSNREPSAEARNFLVSLILKSSPMASKANLEKSTFVGIFGRIEDRKGQYQLFWEWLDRPEIVKVIKDRNIHFVIAGHNVLDHLGRFRLGDLYSKIYSKGLSSHFHFLGRVSQDDLSIISQVMSGFIFPSIFENYPNALLEVLPSCRPVAISKHGCMPEICEGFSNVVVFDPLDFASDIFVEFLGGLVEKNLSVFSEELALRVNILEGRQADMLAFYVQKFPKGELVTSVELPTVGFVVPIYQDYRYLAETLESVRAAMRPGDRCIVVDDCSVKANLDVIRSIVGAHGFEFLSLEKNVGPMAARRAGVARLDTDLIQFCDGDDLLDSEAVNRVRAGFGKDSTLDMMTGTMRCFQAANHCWVPRNGYIWTALHAHFAHSGSMYRRSKILEAISATDERLPLNEDWLTHLVMLAHGAKCRMTPEVTYYYRRFEGTRSTQNVAETHTVSRRIDKITAEQLRFLCPEQNSRLRILFKAWRVEVSEGRGPVTASPLRYQVVDTVYKNFRENKHVSRLLVWAYPKVRAWVVRKK